MGIQQIVGCSCCQEKNCAISACLPCEAVYENGILYNTVPIGYNCIGCNVLPSTGSCQSGSGVSLKCAEDNVIYESPCTNHTYSYMSVEIGNMNIGPCSFNAGTYLCDNRQRNYTWNSNLGQTECDATFRGPPICTWVYGGSDIQRHSQPNTRCTTGTGCNQCTIFGGTLTNPFFDIFGGFTISVSLGTLSPFTSPSVNIGIGNVRFADATCGGCSVAYTPSNGIFRCKGPNTFDIKTLTGLAASNSNICQFPNSIIVEAIH